MVSALKQNSLVDYGSLFFATIGTTIPSFVIAIVFIYLFGVTFHLLPFVGWSTPAHWVLRLPPAANVTKFISEGLRGM